MFVYQETSTFYLTLTIETDKKTSRTGLPLAGVDLNSLDLTKRDLRYEVKKFRYKVF